MPDDEPEVGMDGAYAVYPDGTRELLENDEADKRPGVVACPECGFTTHETVDNARAPDEPDIGHTVETPCVHCGQGLLLHYGPKRWKRSPRSTRRDARSTRSAFRDSNDSSP